MEKQKICIIGGSLTGLVTAICLSKLNFNIDLIVGKSNKNVKSNRTIAISEHSLNFLDKLNISKSLKKEIWPCSAMKLYAEVKKEDFLELFELNKDKKILHMMKNKKIIQLMFNKIKKIKSISVKNNEKVYEITNVGLLKTVKFKKKINKYNLVIICTGNNSSLVKNIFENRVIENSYEESAITTILKHDSIKNQTARQIFLNDAVLALLPISNIETSIVWSVKKAVSQKNKLYIKNKIKFYAKNYLNNIKFIEKIEHNELNLLIRKNYYKDRVLLFGDALHRVHPLAGQGFNMIIRDLIILENTLKKNITLGLDIGNENVLYEFTKVTKSRNLIYSLGIDFLKNFFSIKEKNFLHFRNKIITTLNKNNEAKDIFFNLANKGCEF